MDHPISEQHEMPTQSLPATSLRTGKRLPAARVLLRVVNYLICMALWLIGPAISGLESSFLPAFREAQGRVRRSTRHACGPGQDVGRNGALDRRLDAVAGQIRRDVGARKLATPGRPLLRSIARHGHRLHRRQYRHLVIEPGRSRRSSANRPDRLPQLAQLMPSSFAAVPPRIAMRSSSLRPGVDRM